MASSSREFKTRLLRWYDRIKRDLPWRIDRDPYRVWVSEIMLQQTRVETVIPYFHDFLSAFPSVEALAMADQEQVLARWSGLGYYSRARNLHAGAGHVCEHHDARFPDTRAEALAIPGIGPYTSAAILSIAYEKPIAVVDGNVARVLSRLARLAPPEDRHLGRLEERAGALLDPDRPGDFNQAMMELGATVCTPSRPDCGSCPVSGSCLAFLDDVVDSFPKPKKRVETVALELGVLLIRDSSDRLLLERGRWERIPHLWVPPILEIEPGEGVEEVIARFLKEAGGAGWRVGPALGHGIFRHSITHHRIRFHVLCARGESRGIGDERIWATAGELPELGTSSVVKKALKREAAGPLEGTNEDKMLSI